MALIKCPDCEKDVSSMAPACTNCGRPIAIETPKVAAQEETPKVAAQEKPKEQIPDIRVISSLVIAILPLFVLYYIFPNTLWWVYVLIFLVCFGYTYGEQTQHLANETTINKGNEK